MSRVLVLGTFLSLTTCGAFAQNVEFVHLNPDPNDLGVANAVAGRFAGGGVREVGGTNEPIVWGDVLDFRLAPGSSGEVRSMAILPGGDAIAVGNVAVGGFNRGFFWTEVDGLVLMPLLAGGASSTLTGVNSSGVATGQSQSDPFPAGEVVIYDTVGNVLTPLGFSGRGNEISDNGVVTGFRRSPTGSIPIRWSAAGGLEDLELGPTGVVGEGVSISPDGQTIVGRIIDGTGANFAAIWTDGGIEVIGAGIAYAAIDENWVIGQDGGGAFLYDGESKRELQGLLEELGIDLTGWELQRAAAFTDGRTTIAGEGVDDSGAQAAWVVRNFSLPVPDSDGDGVDDDDDLCIDSDTRETLHIGGFDSGVANPVDEQGCTLGDRFAEVEGSFRRQISLAIQLLFNREIRGRDFGRIIRTIIRAEIERRLRR